MLSKHLTRKDVYLVLFILILSSLIFSVDETRCNESNTLLFTHNIISNFGNFAWLSDNIYILYIFLICSIVTLIQWLFNSNLCKLTEMHNKACGLNKRHQFHELFYNIGLKDYSFWNEYGHHLFVITTVFIALMKIVAS